jgi:hypothetical protein
MKRWITSAAALGLLLAAGPAPAKSPSPLKDPERGATCAGDFGTSIEFMHSPTEAAQWAKKEGKLVLVLHISGHFEDPGLT